MTQAGRPTFSVIVVSRQRSTWLKRCVSALKQQDYSAYELIVVADGESLSEFSDASCKINRFEDANISAARNMGLGNAAGEICAFIDDDAVAEPRWLHHLAAAFNETNADAAVGFVRGRNGISFQSRASSVDVEAETHHEVFAGEAPEIPEWQPGRATKLVGTNMAIRRDVLTALGGFDETFRFFLEDADLSLRLQRAEKRTAIAPLAQVHHGFAPSVRRTSRRAPLDLFDIGRSTRYYLKKHDCSAEDEIWERIEHRERARLVKHMIAGTCEPRDVIGRMRRLREGWNDRSWFERPRTADFAPSVSTFRPVDSAQSSGVVLASPFWLRRLKLVKSALLQAEKGKKVSAFSFSLTPRRHHVRYLEPGVWLQTGGLYGKSDRSDPVFKWCRFADRLQREIRRVAKQRGIGEIDNR